MDAETESAARVPAGNTLPRGILPHPSSPPMLLNQQAPTSKDSTFAFQASTCSDDSYRESDSSHPQCIGHDGFPGAGAGGLKAESTGLSGAHVQMKQLPKCGSIGGPVLLPPAAFEKQRTSQDDWRSHQTEMHWGQMPLVRPMVSPAVAIPSEPLATGSSNSTKSASPSLKPSVSQTVELMSPSIKSEIVRIRDNLQDFQNLKSQQKALQAQLSRAEEEGEHNVSLVSKQIGFVHA